MSAIRDEHLKITVQDRYPSLGGQQAVSTPRGVLVEHTNWYPGVLRPGAKPTPQQARRDRHDRIRARRTGVDSMSKILGRAIKPLVGFAPSKPRAPREGQHLPNAREIGAAFASWRRRQPDRPGSAYFDRPFTSPRS